MAASYGQLCRLPKRARVGQLGFVSDLFMSVSAMFVFVSLSATLDCVPVLAMLVWLVLSRLCPYVYFSHICHRYDCTSQI